MSQAASEGAHAWANKSEEPGERGGKNSKREYHLKRNITLLRGKEGFGSERKRKSRGTRGCAAGGRALASLEADV